MKTGIVLLILAMALTPLTDGLSKALTANQSALFIVFARYGSAGIVALLLAVATRHPISIPHKDRPGQIGRTILMIGAMIAMIMALSMVDLAKAVGGFLIAPVVASLISIAIYRERLDFARLIGAAISFIGAYIILRPEGSWEFGTLLALIGGILLGFYLAATRRAGNLGDAFSSIVVQSLLGALLVLPIAFWGGVPELTWLDWAYILGLGVVSAVCHFLTIAAYHRADASVLAPFFYFNIVFAIPVGYFWFNEIPSFMTLVGLSAITIGGVIAMLSGARYVYVFTGVLGLPRLYARKFTLKM